MGKSVKEGVMPKEYVYNRYYGQYGRSHEGCPNHDSPEHSWDTCDGTPVALDDSAVKVGWTKDRDHVEIAVVRHQGGAETDKDAWHSQFDRAGLNRLIRTLRQARDDAFERDE